MKKVTIEQAPGAAALKPGTKFTIAGCGLSARGHQVYGGRSVKTGRKMKAVHLTIFEVTHSEVGGDKPRK